MECHSFLRTIFVSATLLIPSFSYAGVFFGDTDGDGHTDIVTTFEASGRVEIFHPNRNFTSTYNVNGRFSVNSLANVNGRAGVEIILVQVGFIRIIEDALETFRAYRTDRTYVIHSVVDTDGLAGNEIIVGEVGRIRVVTDARLRSDVYTVGIAYTIHSVVDTDGQPGSEIIVATPGVVKVIHRTGGARLISYRTTSAYEILAVTDTDGRAGNDIVVAWIGSSTIQVIRDAQRRARFYPTGSTAYAVHSVVDTDGRAGNDIIVALTGQIRIIHDARGTSTAYHSQVGSSFDISSVRDHDGRPGAEICYVSNFSPKFGLITDRIGRNSLVRGC